MFIPHKLNSECTQNTHTQKHAHKHSNNEDKLISKANQVRKSHSIDPSRNGLDWSACELWTHRQSPIVWLIRYFCTVQLRYWANNCICKYAILRYDKEKCKMRLNCRRAWMVGEFCRNKRPERTFRRIGTNWIPFHLQSIQYRLDIPICLGLCSNRASIVREFNWNWMQCSYRSEVD